MTVMRIGRFPWIAAFLSGLALALAPAVSTARKDKAKPAPVVAEALPVELTGTYQLDAGPDIAGSLVIERDHRFEYRLAAGALDEEASGTWDYVGARTCLTTVPTPQPPSWRAVSVSKGPTLRAIWPDGAGIAGIGVRLGFSSRDGTDSAELAGGYTLEDGWSLPPDEKRAPRWVELFEPVHNLTSPRFPFDGGRRLVVTLVPNDMNKARFEGACLDPVGTALVLRRPEGDMKFYRVDP